MNYLTIWFAANVLFTGYGLGFAVTKVVLAKPEDCRLQLYKLVALVFAVYAIFLVMFLFCPEMPSRLLSFSGVVFQYMFHKSKLSNLEREERAKETRLERDPHWYWVATDNCWSIWATYTGVRLLSKQ